MAQLQSSSITGSLIISSSGTDSTTNSLLVTNGAGYEYLKVTDGGTVNVRQNLIVNHTTNANRSLRFSWGSIFATDTNNELILGSVYGDSTSTRIYISGKNSDNSPSDAISMQAGNGVAIFSGTNNNLFDPQALLHVSGGGIFTGDLDVTGSLHVLGDLTVGKISNQSELVDVGGNFNFDTVAEPTSAERTNFSSSIISSAGNVDNGTHYYHVIYKTSDGGETGAYGTPFLAATITDNTTAGQVELTGIPTSSDARVTARDIYRTEADDNQYYSKKLATISDNTTTTYTDNLADSSLDQNTLFYRKANSTAGYFYKDNNLFAQAGNAHYTSFGVSALESVTIGQDNVAFGGTALQNTTSGRENTAIGYSSGVSNTTGYGNTYLGYVAGYFNETGIKNTAVGSFALRQATLTSANYNTAVGHGALWKLTGSNNHNTAIGHAAGQGYQGAYNVHIGSYTGYKSTEGSGGDYNINIGYYTGNDTTGDNNILIGRELEAPNSGSSNQLNIGNLIYATGLGSGTTQSTGNVGIGTTTPTRTLDVRGSTLISGSFSGIAPNALVLDNTDSSGNPSIMRMIFSGEGGNEALQIGMYSSPTVKPVYFQSTQGSGWGNIVFQKNGGSVGIGTNSPSDKLQVDGRVRIKSNSGLYIDTSDTYGASAAANFEVVNDASSNPVLRILNSGNGGFKNISINTYGGKLGIGTLNPTTTLHVSGSGNFTDGLTVTGSVKFLDSDSLLTIEDGGSLLTDIKSNYNQLNFRPNNNQALVLNLGGHTSVSKTLSVGRILAPAASANYQLDVSGSGNFTDGLTVTGSILHDGDLTVEGNIYTEGALLLDGVDGLRFNQGGSSVFSPTPGIFYSGTSGQGWYFQVPDNGQEKFSFKLGGTSAGREFRVVDPSWNSLFQVQGTGDAIIANNLTVGGTVTAQEFHTEFVSASIVYQSGSTKFGDTSDDTHSFTGSLQVSGGIYVNDTSGISRAALQAFDSNEIALTTNTWGTGANYIRFSDTSLQFNGTLNTLTSAYNLTAGNGNTYATTGRRAFIVSATLASQAPGALGEDGFEILKVGGTINLGNGGDQTIYGVKVAPTLTNLSGSRYVALQTDTGSVKFRNSDVEISGSLEVTGSITAKGLVHTLANTPGTNGFQFQSNQIKPIINGYISLDRNNNRSFAFTDDAGSREYLRINSSVSTDEANITFNEGQMYISSSGNIGIGTTTPPHKVSSQVSADGNYAYYAANSLGSNRGGIYIDSSGNTELILRTGAGQTASIKASGSSYFNGGKVGIGTTNPLAGLEVANAENSTLRLTRSSNNGNYLQLQGGSSGAIYNINTSGTQDHIFQTGGNEKMRLTSAGHLGINTTSPESKLTVVGSGGAGDAAITSRYSNSSVLGEVSTIAHRNSQWSTLYVSESGGSATNAVFVEGNKPVIFNAGNVGIGTASPQYPLHINNGTGDQSALFESTDVTNTISIKDSNSTSINTTGIGVNADDLFLYAGTTGYNQRLRIQGSTGNVGIGTTSPSYKLQVNGTARFGDGSPYLKVTSTSVEVEGSYLLAGYQSGVSFYAYESVFRGLIKSDSSGGDALKLGDTVERMRIVDGNVGIGTTSPTNKLDVAGAISTTTGIRVGSAIASEWIKRVASPTVSNGIDLQSQGVSRLFAGSNVGIGTTSPTYKLHIVDPAPSPWGGLSGSLNVDDILIVSSSNVGIGTTTPSARLHVSGTADVLLIEGSGSTVNTSIFAIDGNNGRLFEVSDDLSDSLFSVNTIAGLPVMEVFSDNRVTMGAFNQNDLVISGSKVGIGTATPAHKLSVDGNIQLPNGGFIYGQSTGNYLKLDNATYVELGYSSTTAVRADGSAVSIRGTGGTPRLTVQSAGNVGIGTTSPDSPLEIYSDSTTDFLKLTSGGASASPVKLIFEKTTAEQGIIEYNRNGDLEIYNTDGDGGVMLNGRNSEAGDLYVADGGNVGIGITSPSYKLDVSGSINHAGASYIVPATTSGASGATTVLTGTTFDNATLIKASHDNVTTGDYTLELPAASSSTNRTIRIISDSSTDANHNIIIAPTSGDTLDGGASGFTINRNYEGLMVWSDGTEWFIIQSKNV